MEVEGHVRAGSRTRARALWRRWWDRRQGQVAAEDHRRVRGCRNGEANQYERSDPSAPSPHWAILTPGSRPRQVALAGAHDHRLLQTEVPHHHPAPPDAGERPVAAVDDLPDGAADG